MKSLLYFIALAKPINGDFMALHLQNMIEGARDSACGPVITVRQDVSLHSVSLASLA
jgi:hypothetical protein